MQHGATSGASRVAFSASKDSARRRRHHRRRGPPTFYHVGRAGHAERGGPGHVVFLHQVAAELGERLELFADQFLGPLPDQDRGGGQLSGTVTAAPAAAAPALTARLSVRKGGTQSVTARYGTQPFPGLASHHIGQHRGSAPLNGERRSLTGRGADRETPGGGGAPPGGSRQTSGHTCSAGHRYL